MKVSAATRAAARFSILRKNSLFPEETQKCGGLVARPACCANCAMASSDSEQNIIEVAAAARPDRAGGQMRCTGKCSAGLPRLRLICPIISSISIISDLSVFDSGIILFRGLDFIIKIILSQFQIQINDPDNKYYFVHIHSIFGRKLSDEMRYQR